MDAQSPEPQSQPSKPAGAQSTPLLDQDQAKKVLSADVKNLLVKVQSGKPLTGTQRQLIAALASGHDPASKQTANSVADLARVVGVHRHTAAKLLKRADCPVRQASNGEIDVVAFRSWAEPLGLLKAKAGDQLDTRTQLEARRLELQNAILEIDLAVKRTEFVAVEAVKRDASQLAFRIKTSLLALPDSLAPSLTGLDAVETATKLRDSLTDALRHFAENKWTAE